MPLTTPAYQRPAYRDVVLSIPGLVGYWPCADSSATVVDAKGKGGNGTATGASVMRSPDMAGGSSLGFTGSAGAKVNGTGTAIPTALGSSWTIFGWVFISAAIGNGSHLFGFGEQASANTGNGKKRRLIRFSNVIYFWGDNVDLASSADLTVGRPQLIAASYNGTAVTVSKNGVSIGSANKTFVNAPSQSWGMAEKPYFGGGAELTNTRIAHFGIVDRAMRLPDLVALYAEGAR